MRRSLLVFLAIIAAPTLAAAGPITLSSVGNGPTWLTDSRSLTVGDAAWRWDLAPTTTWLPYPTEFTASTVASVSMSARFQQDLWGDVPVDSASLQGDLTSLHEAMVSLPFWDGPPDWWTGDLCDTLWKFAPDLARRLCGGGPGSGNPVPEPATLLLLGSGLAAMAIRQRRRRV